MRDFNQSFSALDQRASGQITIDDYSALVGVKAEGTIEVLDYAGLVGVQSVGTIDIEDYSLLVEAAATATVTIVDYTLLNANAATGTFTVVNYANLEGVTVTVNGQDYIEGVHFDAVSSNNTTAENLAHALDMAESLSVEHSSATVQITATVAGVAGNSIDISSDGGVNLTASAVTLTGGRDYASITVDGDVYVAGTDFDAETNEATTATNLAAAIDAGTDVGAGAVGALVTITATAAGSAGNAIAVANTATAGAWTVSGTFLEGGQDHATFTIDGNDLVQGTNFTAAVSNNATATSLALAINGLSGVGAGATTNQVTITNDAVGVAGNKTMVYVGTDGGATLSAATMEGGVNHATITVGTDTITQGTGFTASANNNTTAESIKTAIHALTGVSATRAGAIITIVNDALGVVGNAKALTTNNATDLDLSGATLEGGVDPCVVTVDSTALTEQTNFTAATSNDATATSLATAIDGIAGVNASAVGNVITIFNDAPGTAGNAKDLLSDWDNAGLTLSGETLEGGVAVTYSNTFSYDTAGDVDEVEEILDVISKTGTLTLDVTPQYSLDNSIWHDATAFAQKATAGSESLNRTTTGLFTRYKIVMGGTNPTATFKITAVAK